MFLIIALLVSQVVYVAGRSCPSNMFGVQCRGVCHCNEGPSVCDSVTGLCHRGQCARGWTSKPYCQAECEEGTFGISCQGLCHCPPGDICDKVNGLCRSGQCEYSWTGYSCQTAMPALRNPPEITSVTAGSISLHWQKWSAGFDVGQGPIVQYALQMATPGGSSEWTTVTTVSENGSVDYHQTVTGLAPVTSYRFRLTLSYLLDGKLQTSIPGPAGHVVATKCDAPTAHPTNIEASIIAGEQTATAHITWQPPTVASLNCNHIRRYEAEVTCSPDCGDCVIPITWQDSSVAITGLPLPSTVQVSLSVVNDEGLQGPKSPVQSFRVSRDTVPSAASKHLGHVVAADGDGTPTVAFALSSSDRVCPSTTAVDVVNGDAGADSGDTDGGRASTFTRGASVTDSLIVKKEDSPQYSINSGNGLDDEDPSSGIDFEHEFNYDHDKKTQHELTIRKETHNDLEDSFQGDLSGVTLIAEAAVVNEDKGDNLVIAAIVIPLVLLLILVLVLLGFLFWRRKRRRTERYKDILTYHRGLTLAQKHNVTVHAPNPSPFKADDYQPSASLRMLDFTQRDVRPFCAPDAETSCHTIRGHHQVLTKDLKMYYQHRRESEFPLSEEFRSLPSGLTTSATIASLPENDLFNRSPDVLPFDKNRVQLELTTGMDSGYINASLVKSTNNRMYIVTQCPMSRTVCAFWRLLWQRHASIIVMLMDLDESRKPQYQKYWPDLDSSEHVYQDIKVTTIKEDRYANVAVRIFEICQLGCDEPRLVKQFQFVSWTPGGVPVLPLIFLDFVDMIHREKHPRKNLVVHCHTGGGRSGVYIAVDSLLQEGRRTGKVDVYRCVSNLRLERPHLVKSLKQYSFIFECLIEAFGHHDTQIQSNKFCFAFDNLLNVNANNCRTVLAAEFDDLQEDEKLSGAREHPAWHDVSMFISPKARQSMSMSVDGLKENKEEDNMIPNGLPLLLLDSYLQQNTFLLLSSPSADVVGDFWNTLYCRNVNCIISLDSQDGLPTPYLPRAEGQSLSLIHCGQCTVTFHKEVKVKQMYVCQEFIVGLTEQPKQKAHRVRHYQYTAWPHEVDVPTVEDFVQFTVDAMRWYQSCPGQRSLAVHGGRGMVRAGLLSTLWYLLERSDTQHLVDIFTAVKVTRSFVPDAVTTLAQYRFLYKAVAEYLRHSDIKEPAVCEHFTQERLEHFTQERLI